jgi:predicted RNA binding protein YcfA (HicA-like mRNA interferase family)
VRGSHYQLYDPASKRRVTVPLHGAISVAALPSIIRQSGLTVDEFLALL